MKKICLVLTACMMLAATSFAQQDTTGNKGMKKKHKTTTSDTSTTGTKNTKHKNKKSGNGNNMDSTATMQR